MNNDNHEFSTVADVMKTEPCVADTETTGLKDSSVRTAFETTPVMVVKRKSTFSSVSSSAEASENYIEAGLAFIKFSLKSAMHEASLGGNKLDSNIYETLDPMLTKQRKL